MDLTERQIQILKAIIDEYIETAGPVGSETLDKKYNLGVSPATIRNEMVRLTTSGYLKQPFTSAGRVPTAAGLKYYVNNLMKAKELSVADEVSVKEKVWDYRNETDRLLRETVRALAEKTKTLSMAATDEGDMYWSGVGNILEMPEFFDIDITKNLLSTLDEYSYWWNIFERVGVTEDALHIIIGEELDKKPLLPCGLVFINFNSPRHKGVLCVIGPSRLDYPYVIPVVRYFGGLVTEMVNSW